MLSVRINDVPSESMQENIPFVMHINMKLHGINLVDCEIKEISTIPRNFTGSTKFESIIIDERENFQLSPLK